MSDDTQPRSPFQQQDEPPTLGPPPEEQANGPGCLVWGLISIFSLLIALSVVIMAGAAGYTAGQREADNLAMATQAEEIQEQLVRIPTDVMERNEYILQLRLDYLGEFAPNLPELPVLQTTATAVYVANLPTATLEPTVTPTVTATPEITAVAPTVEVTEEPVVETTDGQYDLPGLLQRARDHIAIGELEEAYELLDAIIRIDDQFQRATVRGLIFDVLTRQASNLYFSLDTLAEAIRLTDLAEEYGDVGELSYERYMAGLYLSAQSALTSRNFPLAIQYINEMRSRQTEYKGQNLNQLLFNEYVNYAEAFEFGAEYCRAVVQYNNALALFANSAVEGRRDTAQTLCEQGTPLPGVEGQATVAPVGAP